MRTLITTLVFLMLGSAAMAQNTGTGISFFFLKYDEYDQVEPRSPGRPSPASRRSMPIARRI